MKVICNKANECDRAMICIAARPHNLCPMCVKCTHMKAHCISVDREKKLTFLQLRPDLLKAIEKEIKNGQENKEETSKDFKDAGKDI